MRLTACLFATLLLATALPRGARAQEERAAPPPRPEYTPPPPPDDRSPPERRGVAPAPRPAYGPYPRPRPAPRPPAQAYAPARRVWLGWGWGWAPLYPVAPPPAAAEPGYAPAPEQALYPRLALYGAGRSDGYVGGVSVGVEGRYAGFDLDVSALAREPVTGPLHEDGSDPATWGSAHLTWSILSERSFRLRAETGVSFLSLPDSSYTASQEWAGKTLVGPDLGVSGQLGLAGPLGFEGHARVTPFPVRVADVYAGAVLHGGPVGVGAGWRWIDVAGDGSDAPALMFRGPQVSLSLAF